jgi:hypothetical protein
MDIEAIFCQIDDFCQHCEAVIDRGALPATTGKRTRKRASMLSLSEVMTIMVWFHQQSYRTFKDFYTKHVLLHMRSAFPRLPSYNRFVELQSDAALPLDLFLRSVRLARPTGVAFIDSTPLAVCDNHRIAQHTVFRAQARRGKTSMGWFYGFKLHLVVDDGGELLNCVLSPGNVDDRDQRVIEPLSADLWGTLVGDRGYVSKTLFEQLLSKGVRLITKLKKGMANKLMSTTDTFFLRKRGIIESVNDLLKNSCYVEHTRHRSGKNFVANLASGLIAYTFLPKKPSIRYHTTMPDNPETEPPAEADALPLLAS